MRSAVMDSFIHRFSSSKWPITIHPQSSATNRLIDTTDVWSDAERTPILISTDPKSISMALPTPQEKKKSKPCPKAQWRANPVPYVSEESIPATSLGSRIRHSGSSGGRSFAAKTSPSSDSIQKFDGIAEKLEELGDRRGILMAKSRDLLGIFFAAVKNWDM